MDDPEKIVPVTGAKTALFTITLDPSGYEGIIAISPAAPKQFFFLTRPTTVQVQVGENSINTGASLGGKATDEAGTSYIYFTVNELGKITAVNQSQAASISKDGKTLTLKTASVTLDTGAYTGRYNLSAKNKVFLSGTQSLKLVCYQIYTIDCGTQLPAYTHVQEGQPDSYVIIQTSWFNFFVDEKGSLTVYDVKAKAGSTDSIYASTNASTLTIKTVTAWIDPVELSHTIPIQLQDGTVVKSRQEIAFMRGLLTWVKWNPSGIYYFVPL